LALTRKGCLWFAGGLLLALLAGGLAFVAVMQAASSPKAKSEAPKVRVVVAAREIPLQTPIADADVAVREVPPEVVPEGALTDPKDAVGKIVTTPVARDEILVGQRLLKPDYVGPQAALVMDPKKVLVALPAADLLSQLDIIRAGDRVDLMFSFVPSKVSASLDSLLVTAMVLQDVRVAAVIHARPADPTKSGTTTGAPQALLLALDPQDALTVKYFRDNGGAVDFALRSPAAADGPFNVINVDGDYIVQRFKLRRGAGR